MNVTEQPVNYKAAAWTAGVHILLILLLLFVTFSSPVNDNPVQELGMEVNLGTSNKGSGDDQPMNEEDPAPSRASAGYRASGSMRSSTKEIETTDDKEAPAINSRPSRRSSAVATQNDRNRSRNNAQASNNTAAPQRPRYVYQGGTGRGGNSATANNPGGGEGNTTGPGDRGVPGGTPGASNYTGTPGSGNGISHTLSRRSIVAFPPPEADFREGGRVVIRITVNRNGAIVNRQVVSSSNAELRSIALKKLDKVKFNKSTEAPEEQFGNITFVFKTRS
jgi:TonB family protein